MSDVTVSMKLSPKQAGALYVKAMRLESEIKSLRTQVSDSSNEAIHALAEIMQLKAERDALAAQVEALREVANDAIHFASARKDKVCADPMFVMQQLQNRINATPQQHLAEIRAEAGQAGYAEGYQVGFQTGRIGASNRGGSASNEYAAKVRQGGAE